MKDILKKVLMILALIASFFAGFFVRQPSINKLKKQVKIMQKEMANLQNAMKGYQDVYSDLYVQYKKIKVIQIKQKAEMEGKLKDNLILQYGMKDYLNLLFDVVKKERKLSEKENVFYKSFDNVIEGKKVSNKAFENIKEYVLETHKKEINNLKICDCSKEYEKLEQYKK